MLQVEDLDRILVTFEHAASPSTQSYLPRPLPLNMLQAQAYSHICLPPSRLPLVLFAQIQTEIPTTMTGLEIHKTKQAQACSPCLLSDLFCSALGRKSVAAT